MLKFSELISGIDEKYIPMLRMVDIPNFTKCIACFSGLSLEKVSNQQIKEYLLTWAENKYRIFKMLGNTTYKDIPITYEKFQEERELEWDNLMKEYPQFGPWFLLSFKDFPENKITNDHYCSYYSRFFPNLNCGGMSITHFCKKYLKMPDDAITKIGRIYENNKMNATYTISIDPVDIMTASENPYNWTSCYALEITHTSNHSDGCMAAVLDRACTIAYIWTNQGKFNLHHKYELKNLKYKHMRQFVAVSENLTSISFCNLYPNHRDYDSSFCKQLRCVYEKVVADYFNEKDMWKISEAECERELNYGYTEFYNDVYTLKGHKPEDISAYTVSIHCACGCGETLIDNYDPPDSMEYLGEGFNCAGWEERFFCEYSGEYCHECNEENCDGCGHWEAHHSESAISAVDETVTTSITVDVPEVEYPREIRVGANLVDGDITISGPIILH